MPRKSLRDRGSRVEYSGKKIEIVPDARPGAEKRAREHVKKKEEDTVRKRLHAADFNFTKKSYGFDLDSDGFIKAIINRHGTDQTPSSTKIRPASEKNFGRQTKNVKDKAGRMAELQKKYNSPEFQKKVKDRESAQSTYVPDREGIRKEDYDLNAAASEGGNPEHAKYHRGDMKGDPGKMRYTPENTDWSSSSPKAHTITSTGRTITYGPSGKKTGEYVPKDEYDADKSIKHLLTLVKSRLSKSDPDGPDLYQLGEMLREGVKKKKEREGKKKMKKIHDVFGGEDHNPWQSVFGPGDGKE
jgi:hypothetical protein